MWRTIALSYRMAGPTQRREAWGMLGLSVMVGLLDVVGIASIGPFLALLANPDIIESNRFLVLLSDALGTTTQRDLLLATGIIVFSLFVLANVAGAVMIWFAQRFFWSVALDTARRLLRHYLHQPYDYFLTRNPAQMSGRVFADVDQYGAGVAIPALNFVSRVVVLLLISALLLYVDWRIAIGVGLIASAVYGALFLVLRRRLQWQGQVRLANNEERYRATAEALGGVKTIKLLGNEAAFLTRFSSAYRRLSKSMSETAVLAQLPRFAILILAFGGLMGVTLVMIARNHPLDSILPTIGLFAFAGYRLIPHLQVLYAGAVSLRFSLPVAEAILHDLEGEHETIRREAAQREVSPRPLRQRVALRDAVFAYPGASTPAVRGITLEVTAGSRIGLVGTTGAGKTTLVDLLLGLLRPQEGALEVDGEALTDEQVPGWQRSIGYVTQDVYLVDDSITANIAFGVPPNEVDAEAVERAARLAQADGFIRQLPRGYATPVGDRGVRLSGGQRQRLGIARALYRRPGLLVLDEATNALDGVTEDAVLAALHGPEGPTASIIIAHRLKTVVQCERIYLVEAGAVVAEGTHAELMASNAHFRAMAGADPSGS
jgi:ABC-type multidrug transport system fused ATPase/permease subunit